MGYHSKREGDKLNAERQDAFNAPKALYCPWCRLSGAGIHALELLSDGQLLFCPQCHDARPATDQDRQAYAPHTP